jgi:hypothetical protein
VVLQTISAEAVAAMAVADVTARAAINAFVNVLTGFLQNSGARRRNPPDDGSWGALPSSPTMRPTGGSAATCVRAQTNARDGRARQRNRR